MGHYGESVWTCGPEPQQQERPEFVGDTFHVRGGGRRNTSLMNESSSSSGHVMSCHVVRLFVLLVITPQYVLPSYHFWVMCMDV